MSHHSHQKGFSLVELMIVVVMLGLVSVALYSFFRTSFFNYLDLQTQASNFTDLARQSQRVSNVVRGLTDVVDAENEELEIYAYFFPTDEYVSLVHYYLNTDETILYADVTPMTANPPIGTPITASLKTYTIIGNFRQSSGVNLFEYLDATGTTMTLPIADLHTIKGVRVNLAVAGANPGANQAVTAEVSLRNRKTNL